MVTILAALVVPCFVDIHGGVGGSFTSAGGPIPIETAPSASR